LIRKAAALNKKVFVVIVTYNGAHWIDKNISSLLNSTYPVSIIAIDNNSTDNSVTLLEKYPEVELIKSPENLGFGKANNTGMKKALDAGADYIFLLNQDAWVFDGTIGSLVSKMEADTSIGLLSPMHYDGSENKLDEGFSTYCSRQNGKSVTGIPLVSFVNAAAWMLSRKCVEKVGYFEPLYGHYGEDRNYCDRVIYHNFFIGIDEDSKICHDRVIKRNFNKDMVQAKYKVLTAILNINQTFLQGYVNGLREVFGLPKYFIKFYGSAKSINMFFKLSAYYTELVFSAGKIKTIRNNAK
jgi:GT2 family glycosyltransferase